MTLASPNNPWMIDPPRDVPRWFFVRRMQAMVFGALLCTTLGIVLGIGLPVVFYLVGGRVLPTVDIELDRVHATAPAVLTGKVCITHAKVNSRHPSRLGFVFTTPGGVTVSTVGYTFDAGAATLEPGDRLDIEYDPDEPARARPVGGSASLYPLWLYGLVLLLLGPELVTGVILAVATAHLTRTERILLAYGVGAEAEVLDVRPVCWIHFGSNHPYDVVYRFVDHRGLEIGGCDRTYHYDWARGLSPGQRVGVVYNPQDPSANVLWLHGNEVGSGPRTPDSRIPESTQVHNGVQPT